MVVRFLLFHRSAGTVPLYVLISSPGIRLLSFGMKRAVCRLTFHLVALILLRFKILITWKGCYYGDQHFL
jgi:hypothetical protein